MTPGSAGMSAIQRPSSSRSNSTFRLNTAAPVDLDFMASESPKTKAASISARRLSQLRSNLVTIMIRLIRTIHRHAQILRLLRRELCQLDADLIQVQPSD